MKILKMVDFKNPSQGISAIKTWYLHLKWCLYEKMMMHIVFVQGEGLYDGLPYVELSWFLMRLTWRQYFFILAI